MEHVLLVIHVLLASALIGVVLIQRSDSDGFGLGSGSGANLMTGRAAANLMTRTTAIIATLFIISSLVLSVLAAHGSKRSIIDTIAAQEENAPAAPVVPDAGGQGETANPALNGVTGEAPAKAAARAAGRSPSAAKKTAPAPQPTAEAPAPAVPTAE